MIAGIEKIIESRNALAAQALLLYQPIVKQYIIGNCKDSDKIAYALDFMLGFCFDAKMLLLYRQLCQHVFSFDPETAVYYVNAYREMWDEEGKDFGNKINHK